MGKDTVIDQIAGIFARNEIPYGVGDDNTFRVLRGSAAVFISVVENNGLISVGFRAPVVEHLNLDDDTYGKAVFVVNDVNCRSTFGRYCLYADDAVVMLEHEILGNEMQASELLTILDVVSAQADNWDDTLSEELGGKTYEAVELEISGGALET